MPKSLWVAVAALGVLLARLLWHLIQSFRQLQAFQWAQAILDSFVQNISAWDKFFVGLLMLGIGLVILRGLVKGQKLAWWAGLIQAYFTLVVTSAGYFIGGWMMDGVRPTLQTGFHLFLYLLLPLILVVSLSLASAKAYFKSPILWKPFLKKTALAAAGVLLFVILWSCWATYYSSRLIDRNNGTQSTPKS